MNCKICGDPIKRCPRRSTNYWCHTWHHNHKPIPTENFTEKLENITEKILTKGEKVLKSGIKTTKKLVGYIADDLRRDAEYRNKRSRELVERCQNSEAESFGWSRGRHNFEEERKERKRAKREMNEFYSFK